MSVSKLEKDIVAMLADTRASSASVASMIEKVERVVAVAEKAAAAEEIKALDLETDPATARAARDEVVFARDRLRAALPKLQQQLASAYAAEDLAGWIAEYRALKVRRDAVALRFQRRYPELASELSDILAEVGALDEEIGELDGRSPPGHHLDQIDVMALGSKVVLPPAMPGQAQMWPRPRRIDPAFFAPVHAGAAFGPDWVKVSEEKQRQLLRAAEEAAAR